MAFETLWLSNLRRCTFSKISVVNAEEFACLSKIFAVKLPALLAGDFALVGQMLTP
jgi:hypothetical protein